MSDNVDTVESMALFLRDEIARERKMEHRFGFCFWDGAAFSLGMSDGICLFQCCLEFRLKSPHLLLASSIKHIDGLAKYLDAKGWELTEMTPKEYWLNQTLGKFI
jgi:hypothetical protein